MINVKTSPFSSFGVAEAMTVSRKKEMLNIFVGIVIAAAVWGLLTLMGLAYFRLKLLNLDP